MIFKNKQLTILTPIAIYVKLGEKMILNSYIAFVAKFIYLKLRKKLQVIKCIMDYDNHTLKMANTNNFSEIIEKDTPLA